MKSDEIARRACITTDMFNRSHRLSLDAKLKLFSDSGFRYLHWCDDWDNGVLYDKEQMGQTRRLIESFGMKCIDVHSCETSAMHIAAESHHLLEGYTRLLMNRIEFCATVGGDAVVIHPPTPDSNPGVLDRKLKRSLQVIEGVRPLCGDLGVSLSVENCYRGDEKMLEFYFERYPPEFMGFCYDSGHANLSKSSEALAKFGDRLNALHLHDNRGSEDDHQPPYWGTVDWAKVVEWIKRCGYSKPINFEITHSPKHFKGTPEEFMDRVVRSVLQVLALFGR